MEASVGCQLDTSREEGTSIGKLPPLEWLVDMSEHGHFLYSQRM